MTQTINQMNKTLQLAQENKREILLITGAKSLIFVQEKGLYSVILTYTDRGKKEDYTIALNSENSYIPIRVINEIRDKVQQLRDEL